MILYKLIWEEQSTRADKPKTYEFWIKAERDSLAKVNANRLLPENALNVILFKVGTEVQL